MARKYTAECWVCVTFYLEASSLKEAQAMVDDMSTDELASGDIDLAPGLVMSPAVTFYPDGVPGAETTTRAKAEVDR